MDYLDYSGFSALFAQYYRQLVSFANRYLASEEDARDAVQNCFVKLWEKKDRYTGIPAQTLLFTMVRNACLDELKHKLVVTHFEHDFFNIEEKNDTHIPGVYEELRRNIYKEVNKLPDRCREVFLLSRLEGLSNVEISRKLGISEPVVHKHIDKAIKKLEKILK